MSVCVVLCILSIHTKYGYERDLGTQELSFFMIRYACMSDAQNVE